MTANPTARTALRAEHRQLLLATAGALLAIIALLIAPGSAHAIGADTASTTGSAIVQQQIEEAMLVRPGGIQISATEVSWESGAVILTVDDGVGAMAIGSCATGAFCAWDGANLTGSKLSFTSCGTHSTAGLSVVRSIANARSSGSVQAKNASGTVITTLSAGSSTGSAPLGVKKLTCL